MRHRPDSMPSPGVHRAPITDDEFHSFPGPETLAYHAFMHRAGESFKAPARRVLSMAGAVRRICSSLYWELQNALVTRSIYDLHYQYEKSLDDR